MSYIDKDDRVVVLAHIEEQAHARMPYPDAVGKHGIVLSNDGWGLCAVKLDDGSTIRAWNHADLVREEGLNAD